MKIILFASVLALSTAAIAQDAAPAGDSSLPACSRTVTDRCVQKPGWSSHKMKKHTAKKHHAAKKMAAKKPAAEAPKAQ